MFHTALLTCALFPLPLQPSNGACLSPLDNSFT